jgi:hypothetical protein
MGWVPNRAAPERALAVRLAGDKDAVVVRSAVLTAHRAADHEPELAHAIIVAVSGLTEPQLAEDVCMVLSHDIGLAAADEDRVLARLVACPTVDYWHDRLLGRISRQRPEEVLAYLLARIERRHGPEYRPVPYEGLSGDPLSAHPKMRADLVGRILDFTAAHLDDGGVFDARILFWSYAGGTTDALHVLAEGLTSQAPQLRQAALETISVAPHGITLANPEWVTRVLDVARGDLLDELQGALSAGLTSGIKQGTPGKPFPRDALLRDRATQLAAAARPGSRAATFWTMMIRAAESDIQRSLKLDSDLDEE